MDTDYERYVHIVNVQFVQNGNVQYVQNQTMIYQSGLEWISLFTMFVCFEMLRIFEPKCTNVN